MPPQPSQFRALHDREGAFIIPNPWDAGSARILAHAGFAALATTSAGHAFSLGVPEGTLANETVLAHCRDMVRATPLPVSADLEKGFGDSPQSAHDTIIAAAATGLAGCSIEDHTGDPSAPIYEHALAVERIAAAVEAARGLEHDFVLTARCENLLWDRPGLDDVIARLAAYEAAGADVLYAPGLRTIEDIRTVCSALTRPVNVIMGLPGCTLSQHDIAEAGARRISIGSALARKVYGEVIAAAREMMGTGTFGFAGDATSFAELDGIFRSASRVTE